MSTTSRAAAPQPASFTHQSISQPTRNRAYGPVLVTALTVLALFIHGYHPYTEDGGLYVAGIKRLLHPGLYAASAPFVDAHLRYSLFAPLMVGLVRISHLSLPIVLFAIYITTLWATLYAVWRIARHCFSTRAGRAGAVLLTALWLTLPVAGTSLILVDPYLTARGLSLPCILFAVAGTLAFFAGSHRNLRREALFASLAWVIAAIMHPLMAGYGLGATLLLACFLAANSSARLWVGLTLCGAAVAAAGMLHLSASVEPTGYLPIALSRYYWFLSRWHWYELFGLIAPLAILSVPALRSGGSPLQSLARMSVAAGLTAIVIALLFAHADGATHLVARMQPLRIFQLIYIVMIVHLGGLLGERLLRGHLWRWLTVAAVFGILMFSVQRSIYSASAHIEWPGVAPTNPWEQAFLWVRDNTPADALFALDADYIQKPQEDAQSFRAIAERSALPDYSKDGGEASITPALTAAWTIGQQVQDHLSDRTDAQRLAALHPLNVTWVVLQRQAKTAFACPFRNAAVQVCRLP